MKFLMEPTDVVGRMMEAAGVEKVCDLAKILGVKAHAVSNWKKRGVPFAEIHKLSQITGASMAWLETGEEQVNRTGDHHRLAINLPLLASAIGGVEEYLEEEGLYLKADKRAEIIAHVYGLQLREGKVPRAVLAAIVAQFPECGL